MKQNELKYRNFAGINGTRNAQNFMTPGQRDESVNLPQEQIGYTI